MVNRVLKLVAMTDEIKLQPQVIIVPTTAGHVRELFKTIRAKDRAEIENFGWTAGRGLWRSYKGGMMNQCAIIDGEVAAIWGVGGTFLGDTGQPYLLTSDAIKKISPLKFARLYQREVFLMLSMFRKLENHVCNNYPEAIRLLSIVGFTIGEPEKVGTAVYRRFTMERREC